MFFYASMKDINCAVLLSVLKTFNRWSKLSFNAYYDWSGQYILSSSISMFSALWQWFYLHWTLPLEFPGAWNSSRVKPSRVRLPPALQLCRVWSSCWNLSPPEVLHFSSGRPGRRVHANGTTNQQLQKRLGNLTHNLYVTHKWFFSLFFVLAWKVTA